MHANDWSQQLLALQQVDQYHPEGLATEITCVLLYTCISQYET